MKTADSIAQQQEAQESLKEPSSQCENYTSSEQRDKQRDFPLRPYCWKPGQSGNPGGRPKKDKSADFARSLFELEPEELERMRVAFHKQLMKGNAYVFKELAERGYGKLKETHAVETHGFEDAGITELTKRLIAALGDLKLIGQIEALGSDSVSRGDQASAESNEAAAVLPGNGAAKTGPVS